MNDFIKAIQYKTKEGENILFITGFGEKRAYRMSRELTEEELKEAVQKLTNKIAEEINERLMNG